MEEITRPTFMEISLDNFYYNINQIKAKLKPNVKIMPVIKGNAYGTYINHRLDVINHFDIVAVATVDEGVFLRNLGYEKEIFVLNQPFETEIDKIIKYNIVVGISSNHFAQSLGEYKQNIKVHLEIGTGMGRTGINPNRVEEYLNALPKNIQIEGVYTHFSSADTDDEYSKKQLASFNVAISKVKSIIGEIKYIHASASNAILNYPEAHFNLVRPGIIMYGYAGAEDTLQKIDLKPVAKLKSTISFLKEVKEGTSIGYNRSYVTTKQTKVATVPIGYADGYRRTFSNGWQVLINGKKVPIIGKVCMDSCMVDVTELPDVKLGDEVIIWDNENIKVEDLAEKCQTINHEILCMITDRVPRKFICQNYHNMV